ncbi:heavy metal translocating P-type ATPase [Paeniglutamicibacter sulfureus]|uniref:heavy metal translocating P-type ATPase n=1 Tax=Paeniglutamicibacter sulfureus TaxID=43666 RepID=UPI002666C68A|nr:heavy metal translocating P-type ATPase [Paeniglutamicibacter sulfureus]MDO2933468.1 heavy metal translocating P-type ATPase [Paeniglutamicibacter sulfureus]
MFRSKFWLSLALSVPVLYFSPMVGHLLGYHIPVFPGSSLIPPVLGTIIFLYGGTPFLKGGASELKDRQPGMMLLISLAITVAFAASWTTTLGIGGFNLDFWWELSLLVVIMLLGHWIEMRALGSARGALDALAELLPDEAERITDTGTETVALSELASGDILLVRSGARLPADGEITEGRAELDESMITGESKTVPRSPGDTVIAGTVATDSALRVRVTATGADTALAGIQRLVAEAQASSSRAQALADRAAALLFYFALGAGALTFIIWLLLGSPDEAVIRTVTVLVIACPHALGLAIPLVIAISTEQAARAGVLIKNRIALERMRTIDVVLFDKTGTLTKGRPAVTGIAGSDGVDENEVLALAAAVEADSEHPSARAIVEAARAGALAVPQATGFASLTGRGATAEVDGCQLSVGGPNLIAAEHYDIPTVLASLTAPWTGRGASVLHVIRDGQVIGALALEDEVREESLQAIRALQNRGIMVAMITGDAAQVAEAVAAQLGIDEVFAQVLPQDKDKKVAELQGRGLKVAMVGDGVNDSPALARAEVGIAIDAGTDVAVESAGVVLAGNDPRAVLSMVDLSRASYRKMIQNLAWATGYNIIAVPLAAGALAFAGVAISPAVAAILMSVSTIVVALNAQLLRRLRLDPTTNHQPLSPTTIPQPGHWTPEHPGKLEGRQSSERRETCASAQRCGGVTLLASSRYRPF